MAGLFKSLKRVLTGKIIRQSDVQIMNGSCIMSLRIKRDSGSGGVYVVLASKASGNYQYYPFDAEEFDSFVDAAIEIKKALRSDESAGIGQTQATIKP
ncbi:MULTISPECIES: hypothetical protein [Rhizobium]|uniref:hypothetical protein n=2 Tax=Rhizobium/Agrobacterium group TaxID=227290 RepID=UPI001B31EB03|nr:MULTISPECIES: hypothetical protein [Rhizobium]MBX5234035.1 hypothetical protein [Rhizobium sp. NLR4a]MBX4906999.1 hypothetical protein [Rhizobium bangladeshense]MBX5253286.1 hypothetical protein [Rhizobium sp. NLR4b]MBX5256112.1 hypothetical protein [Rhizobium sp. NLR16b]MBX5262207.1 hypothetical protein [Rhizobium sp. NLR16a]